MWFLTLDIYEIMGSFWGLVHVKQVLCKMSAVSFVNMRHGNPWGWPSPSSGGSLGIPGRWLGQSQPSGMQSSEEVTAYYLIAIYQFSDLGQDFTLSSSVSSSVEWRYLLVLTSQMAIKKKWGNERKCLSHSKLDIILLYLPLFKVPLLEFPSCDCQSDWGRWHKRRNQAKRGRGEQTSMTECLA